MTDARTVDRGASTVAGATSVPVADQRAAGADASFGQLVSDATERVSLLVRKEVELAKAEISDSVKKAGLGAGLFGAAGFFGLFAFLFFSLAAAWALDLVLPTWAAFLIVGAVYGLIALVLALRGKKSLTSVSGPQRTVTAVKNDLELAKHPTAGTAPGSRQA